MAVTKAQVAQLYVALFNRAPEGAGLNAWFAAGATKTQAQLADDMLRSPAVQSYFNGRIDTDRGFVSNIYKNFLGKDYADDPAGIESWVRHLEAGHSRGETLVKLFEVAQTPEAIAAAPVAAAIFRNKTAVSAYMAEKIADIAQRDDGTYDYEPFQAIIRGTTDTNLEEQKAKVDQLASGQTPSTNKNLTAETDNIVGTDGDDTFNGVYYVGDGAKTSTLSSLDTLDGKAGKDTLNLTVQKNGALPTGTTGVLTSDIAAAMRGVSNIENLNIRSEIKFQGNADISMGLDNLSIQTIGDVATTTDTKEKVTIDTTGVVNLTANEATKEIIAKSSSEAVTVSASKVVDKVSIEAGKQVELNAAEVKDVSVKAGSAATSNTKVIAPKATKASINLTNNAKILDSASSLTAVADLTLANLTLAADLAVAKAAKISTKDVKFDGKAISTDIENVDFSMEYTGNNVGDAKLTASATDKVKTLSINAKAQKSATLTIDNAKINSLTKVTVKGDAKDLTLDLSAQTALKDIDASAFTGNFAELYVKNTENSTFKLGSGDDVVKLNLDTTPANQKTQTIDGGAGTDLVSVTSNTAETGAGDKVTFNNFEGLKISNTLAHNIDMSKWSGFTNITLADGSESKSITKLANNSTITLEKVALAATKNLTLGVKDADTGTDDTVNLVLDPKDNPTAGIANEGNIIVENIETVNITSKTNEAKTSELTNKIILKTGAAAADALKTITVKGDADTVLALDATATKVKTVDASALEGKFTFDATAHLADKAVIKGGAKDDTITVAGKSGASITGGAGNDTFKVGTLGDTAAFPASKVATIKDFSAGDKLHLGAHVATPPTSIVKYEASGSLDFANNLSRALDAAGGQDKLAYFTYTDPDSNSTDTYLVRADGTPGITAGDYVVKLAGTVNLDNARFSNVDTDVTTGVDTLQITL
jgi:putative surface array protein